MGTNTQMRHKPVVEHTLDIGRFVYYPNIVVGEINEGVHVTMETVARPLQIGADIYGMCTPFVYISHRLHSYSIDPIGYYEAVKRFPNFVAYGIVAKNQRRRMLAHLERLFMKKPIRVFDDLENAFAWADEVLENNPTKN